MTCRLVFANVDLQKQHYSSEWHRYNAKRQVADLPPIGEEQFESKVKTYQEAESAVEKNRQTEKVYCQECRKLFQSQNSYDNHLNSKKHKQNVESYVPADEDSQIKEEKARIDKGENLKDIKEFCEEGKEASDGSDWETVRSDDDEDDYDESKAIPNTTCLFCPTTSTSFGDNLQHMALKHGFFVPDSNYCCDVEGLVTYLGMKVGCGNYCIQCSNKRFRDLNSCQLHMRDKAHCKFSVEGDLVVEYLDFYDYAELLKDDDNSDDDVAMDLGYTLVLPSGAKLGHRSLMRYYQQKLRPVWDADRLKRSKDAQRLHQKQFKALGWTGTTGIMAIKRAHDFKFMKNMIKKNILRQELHGNKLFKSRGRDDQL